jgi:hypothetical protein
MSADASTERKAAMRFDIDAPRLGATIMGGLEAIANKLADDITEQAVADFRHKVRAKIGQAVITMLTENYSVIYRGQELIIAVQFRERP